MHFLCVVWKNFSGNYISEVLETQTPGQFYYISFCSISKNVFPSYRNHSTDLLFTGFYIRS